MTNFKSESVSVERIAIHTIFATVEMAMILTHPLFSFLFRERIYKTHNMFQLFFLNPLTNLVNYNIIYILYILYYIYYYQIGVLAVFESIPPEKKLILIPTDTVCPREGKIFSSGGSEIGVLRLL